MQIRRLALAPILTLAFACGGGDGGETADSLADTAAQSENEFWVDAEQYTEMTRGRRDTVDMTSRADDAAWHIQQMNYGESWMGMTVAAWYTGPDSLVRFAEDGQPRLVDDLGNVYPGSFVGENPRIKVESGTTAIGVFVFEPQIHPEADSLTLYVNDSTPPVIRVGPFGVHHDAAPPVGVQPGS